MIRCKLSELLVARKKTISEFSKLTGIHRNTLTRMANQTATRVELSVVEKICCELEISIGELYEIGDAPIKDGVLRIAAFDEAFNHIVVFSPLISSNFVNKKFISMLTNSLSRIESVYLVYGPLKDESAINAHEALITLSKKFENLHLVQLDNLHMKAVIIDGYVMNTTRNLLTGWPSNTEFDVELNSESAKLFRQTIHQTLGIDTGL